jgi:rhamnulokinase
LVKKGLYENMNYYLAVDLGASSGKHLLARVTDEKIEFEEVHRFKNGFIRGGDFGNTLCWDIDYLFGEIITGIKKCADIGKIPSFIGIDSWGVDYVLINDRGALTGNAVSYRDNRTKFVPEQVYELIPEKELYGLTGIQRQPFNTIYQLYAQNLASPHEQHNAQTLLMLPCYFNYLLTGIKANEYTVASTSGLLNAVSGEWDNSIITRLGFRRDLFHGIKPAGTILGELTEAIAHEVGFQATIVLTAAHDTASAVLAAPLSEKSIYLSSGTWSLMGIEITAPVTSRQSRINNFTNEGGFGRTYRLLKNIMGLWMLRAVKRDFGDRHNYDVLSAMAQKNADFTSVVDVSDNRFLAPESMVNEITGACADSGLAVPQTAGEVCAVIYRSLSDYYGKTARAIEALTGKSFDAVNMVGGGTRDSYLNKLTAQACGKNVYVGPTEATALGNIIAQMIATGEITDVKQAREMLRNSITPEEYLA